MAYKKGDRFSQYDDISHTTIHRVIEEASTELIQNVRGKPRNRNIYTFTTDPKCYTIMLQGKEREYEYTKFTLTGIQIREMIARGSLKEVVTIKRVKHDNIW